MSVSALMYEDLSDGVGSTVWGEVFCFLDGYYISNICSCQHKTECLFCFLLENWENKKTTAMLMHFGSWNHLLWYNYKLFIHIFIFSIYYSCRSPPYCIIFNNSIILTYANPIIFSITIFSPETQLKFATIPINPNPNIVVNTEIIVFKFFFIFSFIFFRSVYIVPITIFHNRSSTTDSQSSYNNIDF